MRIQAPALRKLLSFGTGAGIEIGEQDLTVSITRVRPSGTRVLGAGTIARFRERPAAEWGAEYNDFLKKLGASHLSATVILPRKDLIVRQLTLAGVADGDMASAIGFQVDSLHPYGEDEAAFDWCRIGPAGNALVGIVRRQVLNQYVALFAEAGIKVSSFSFFAAAIHSGARLLQAPPAGFLAVSEREEGLELYGESEARLIFSAGSDLPRERAEAVALAELRLPVDTAPVDAAELLPRPQAAPEGYDFSRSTMAYAAALAGACPLLALPLNLLPPENRISNSRLIWIPTGVLVLALVGALAWLASINPIEDRKYLAALEREIARFEPQAMRASALERQIDQTRARTKLLDGFRGRAKTDLDAIAELTKILQPPAWSNGVELNRNNALIYGQAEQAAPLLRLIDSSPMFQNSEFAVPISRAGKNEAFRIRTVREASK